MFQDSKALRNSLGNGQPQKSSGRSDPSAAPTRVLLFHP
jgi:hypothetical protein